MAVGNEMIFSCTKYCIFYLKRWVIPLKSNLSLWYFSFNSWISCKQWIIELFLYVVSYSVMQYRQASCIFLSLIVQEDDSLKNG